MHQAFCQPLMINWHRPCHPKTISNSSRIIWWAKNPLEYLERQCIPPLLRPWNRPWIIKTRLEQHSRQPTPDFSLYFVLRYKVSFFYVFSLSKPSTLFSDAHIGLTQGPPGSRRQQVNNHKTDNLSALSQIFTILYQWFSVHYWITGNGIIWPDVN